QTEVQWRPPVDHRSLLRRRVRNLFAGTGVFLPGCSGVRQTGRAPDAVGPEILVTKNATPGPGRHIYQAPIGYVSQPKQDKRDQHYVSAEVQRGSLGMGTVFLPCEVVR